MIFVMTMRSQSTLNIYSLKIPLWMAIFCEIYLLMIFRSHDAHSSSVWLTRGEGVLLLYDKLLILFSFQQMYRYQAISTVNIDGNIKRTIGRSAHGVKDCWGRFPGLLSFLLLLVVLFLFALRITLFLSNSSVLFYLFDTGISQYYYFQGQVKFIPEIQM